MPREWIEVVHDPAYVDEVLRCAVPPAKERRIGYLVTPHVSRRSQLSVGGTWLAAKLALSHGFAANAAGGSHHAQYETGAGYCVFNDLVIAANRLIAEGTVARILVLDLDVHQGDGTAALTAGTPEIFTLSVHAERNFPVRKASSSLHLPLPDGTSDQDYLATLAEALPQVLSSFRPELILLQAGVDTHSEDQLGRLALTDDGLAARDELVADLALAHGAPVASTLGGGYGVDRLAVARRHAASMLRLAARLSPGAT